MTQYDQTVPGPAAAGGPLHGRATPVTTGQKFSREDLIAFIAASVITLMPLAMGAFWVPYH